MNFRNGYEFDPETYAVGGGLPGMLWRALQQHGQQQGSNANSTPNAAPEYDPNSYTSPQGGLIGRLLALQAEQSRYRPIPENGGQPSSAPPNPNFRQVSRAPTAVRPQGTIGPSDLPDDQSSPTYSPFGEGALLDLLRTSRMQQNQYRPPPNDGVDYDVLARLIQGHESRHKPNAKNKHSTATGPGQFINDTWIDVLRRHRPDIQGSPEQLRALRSDPALSNEMTKAYAQDNAKMLRGAKLPVTPGNIYLAHFAGPNGAKAVLTADPSTPIESILSKDALDANTKNPNLRAMNAGELRAWADQVVAEQAKKLATEKKDAFQRAFSTPQQPLPVYPQPPSPDVPSQPVRRLVGLRAGNQ